MPNPRLLALAAILAIALVGCTTTDALPTPSLTPPAESAELLNPDLQPLVLTEVTEATASAEGARMADALQALIDPDTITNIDDASQVAPAQDDFAPYYVVYRTISLEQSVDCLALAEALAAMLAQSSWTQHETTNEGGVYLSALSAGTTEQSWFTLIGGDASVEGLSTITFQIASPDIA